MADSQLQDMRHYYSLHPINILYNVDILHTGKYMYVYIIRAEC